MASFSFFLRTLKTYDTMGLEVSQVSSIRVADFSIRGKMIVPDDAEEEARWENEVWEYRKGNKIYRLVPCIEVEEDDKIYYLQLNKNDVEGFEFCALTEANWMEE